jgi:hypothetical protein
LITGIVCLCVSGAFAIPAAGNDMNTPNATTAVANARKDYVNALKEMARRSNYDVFAAQASAQKAFVVQMRKMLVVITPEQRVRMIRMLKFQRQLLRWATGVVFLPPPEAAGLAQYWLAGRRPELLAALLASNKARKIDALNEVSHLHSWQADSALAYALPLLGSSHPGLVTAAVQALETHPPSAQIISQACREISQWQRPAPNIQLNILGQRYFASLFRSINRKQATILALRLLERWHPRHFRELIADRLAARPGPLLTLLQMPETASAATDLLLRLKPKQLPHELLTIVHSPSGATNMVGNNAYFDSRTAALYLLIKLAGKDPGEYHFHKINWYGGTDLWAEKSATDQFAAIAAMSRWYSAHGHAPAQPAWWNAPVPQISAADIAALATQSEKLLDHGLSNLGAEKFQARQKASAQLRNGITTQIRAILMVGIRRNLQHAMYLLESEEGFTTWAIWAMQSPKDVRDMRLRWGFLPRNQQLAAQAFGFQYNQRAEAAKSCLKRRHDPTAMAILNHMLHTQSEYVFLKAATTILQISPTQAMTRAFYKACTPHQRDDIYTPRMVNLLGEHLQCSPRTSPLQQYQKLDAAILVHWNPRSLPQLISATVKRWLSAEKKAHRCTVAVSWNQKWKPFAAIFVRCRPPEAIDGMLQLLQQPGLTEDMGRFACDNRQPLICMLAEATGKSPADFGMVRPGRWGLPLRWAFASLNAQQKCIARIIAWWKQHPAGSVPGNESRTTK